MKTAIDWLVEQVNADCLNSTFIRPELIEQGKAKGREQMLELISFVRVNNKMGKTAEDLLEQFETYKGGDK